MPPAFPHFRRPGLLLLAAVFGLFLSAPTLGQVILSEFLASNQGGLKDGYNDTPDWIELQNVGTTATNLAGWHLTDDATDLDRWTFPDAPLAPGAFLVVFASGKDRRDPAGYLHTSFQLGAGGEHLALVASDGHVASANPTPFRPQVANVSFGQRGTPGFAPVLKDNAPVRAFVPLNDALGTNWIRPEFDDSAWPAGNSPVGFEDAPENYAALLQTDVRAMMRGLNTSCYVRFRFTVDDPAAFLAWRLFAKYDDGFVLWLNGEPVGSRNAPAALPWNAAATANHPDADALVAEAIDLPEKALRAGVNVLAVHGLNQSLGSSDFLFNATIEAQPVGAVSAAWAYFTTPTPGRANTGGVELLGPLLSEVGHSPQVADPAAALVVTTRVARALSPVASVRLRYVVQFGSEVELSMLDDGAHGDGAANDGVFGASIPAGVAQPGQMIRYFIQATDNAGNSAREPLYLSPLDSEKYHGTVVTNPAVTSQLPIVELFVPPASVGAIDGESGGRVAVFFDGELYDNVLMEVRGNTTAGCNKKSHRFEFPRDHKLKHPGPGGRIRRTSFMADYADPSMLRQHLSFWLAEQAGLHAPFYYPVRMQMNGQFYQLAFHSDVMGEEQLERFGLDPDGALYKAVGVVEPGGSSTGGFQKKTRDWEGTQDYVALANAINSARSLAQRRTNVFDLLDLPIVINYMAVARIVQEEDDVWANMTLYRDTDGDGEWRTIPFDMNLSWGQLYGGGTVQATTDTFKSHPLYGNSSNIQAGGPFGGFNHLYDAIIRVPETRQMLLRRLRTLMDRVVQPPGTPANELVLEKHINSLTNSFWTEAFLDRSKWGWPVGCGPYGFGANLWLTNGVNALQNQFITPRRRHLYQTHSVTNTAKAIGLGNANNAGIPLAQPTNAAVSFGEIDFNPASHNQAEEFIQLVNTNSFAVDLSGWRLTGGIEFEFVGGTVIPTNSALYLSPSPAAFRARTTGPRGGQTLFVHGPYRGQLSARGETLRLFNDLGREVSSFTYAGNPGAAQQHLKITEIHFHPAKRTEPGFSEEEFEFVELQNTGPTTLDLTGVRFVNGLNFDFTTNAVKQLGAGETVLVVKNQAAFAARYGPGFRVAGEYVGLLDNDGDRLQLVDAVNEEIADFRYEADWFPATDGLGPSLELIAAGLLPGEKLSWRASASTGGTPGRAAAQVVTLGEVHLTAEGLAITFTAEAGIAYAVEQRDKLTEGTWTQAMSIPAAAMPGPVTVTVPLPSLTVGFLRIVGP